MNIKEDNWSSLLLDWFDAHGRDLPWRDESPRDPYKVWVSEIMLQQTKVETVRPYYDSWMERFPNIKSLAAASQDDVLRQWQGLGYYSRARNLHDAVQEVQAKYGGRVPDTKKEVRALKGVGDYTAGAILSLAYGKKEAAVDGNVLRIFARLYDIEENVLTTAVKKQVAALVEEQMPEDRPGAFNEALMDLGATICIPKHPRCEDCPLGDICLARAAGKEGACRKDYRRRPLSRDEVARPSPAAQGPSGFHVGISQRPGNGTGRNRRRPSDAGRKGPASFCRRQSGRDLEEYFFA